MGNNTLGNEAIQWPFGAAKEVTVATFAATMAAEIYDRLTILKLPTLTGNATLDITPGPEVRVGDSIILQVKATATETLTLGSNIEGPTIVGVAGKTKQQRFTWTGAAYTADGAVVQID